MQVTNAQATLWVDWALSFPSNRGQGTSPATSGSPRVWRNGVNQSCRYKGQSWSTRCRLDASQEKAEFTRWLGRSPLAAHCFSQRPMWERSTLMYQYRSPVVIGHAQYSFSIILVPNFPRCKRTHRQRH